MKTNDIILSDLFVLSLSECVFIFTVKKCLLSIDEVNISMCFLRIMFFMIMAKKILRKEM